MPKSVGRLADQSYAWMTKIGIHPKYIRTYLLTLAACHFLNSLFSDTNHSHNFYDISLCNSTINTIIPIWCLLHLAPPMLTFISKNLLLLLHLPLLHHCYWSHMIIWCHPLMHQSSTIPRTMIETKHRLKITTGRDRSVSKWKMHVVSYF